MTEQYQQQSINLEVETAFKSFIYNPNAGQSDYSFSDWDALLVALGGIPGIKQILIPQYPPSVTIPPGTYDMTNIVLSGETPLAVAIIDDVIFENLSKISDITLSVGATVANTTSNFIINDGAINYLSVDKVTFSVGAFAVFPIFDVSAATTLAVSATNSVFLSSNVGVPVFVVDATSTLAASTQAGCAGNNWGGSPGDPAFATVTPGGNFALKLATGDIFWSTNNPAGPTAVVRSDDYEEASTVDWSGTAPLNVKEALDRIAAAVGPIA